MSDLRWFEQIVRRAHEQTEAVSDDSIEPHPFELRNVHPDLPVKTRQLFDDGYYAEATFEAFKFVEQEIKRLSRVKGSTGFALMMDALNEAKPKIALNELSTESEVDEQKGFRHMFAGAQSAIRNPRAHESSIVDAPDVCLDHLSVASVLLRRLDAAGVR